MDQESGDSEIKVFEEVVVINIIMESKNNMSEEEEEIHLRLEVKLFMDM